MLTEEEREEIREDIGRRLFVVMVCASLFSSAITIAVRFGIDFL